MLYTTSSEKILKELQKDCLFVLWKPVCGQQADGLPAHVVLYVSQKGTKGNSFQDHPSLGSHGEGEGLDLPRLDDFLEPEQEVLRGAQDVRGLPSIFKSIG